MPSKKSSSNALRWAGAAAFFFFIWFALLMTRRLGLHIDENNYFRMAHTDFYGDSAASNKPFVFYALNYLFMNGVGLYSGALHAVSLHLFYMALLLAGCVFLVQRLADGFKERLALLAAICLSPFVVFNSTQLMMENAQYPVLAALFAVLLAPGSAATTKSQIAIFLLSALSVFIKETSVAPLLVLAFAFREKKARLWPLWAAAAIGVNLAIFASQGGVDTPQKTYGSLTTIPALGEFGLRLSKSLQFGWTFFFLLSLPLAVAALAARKKDPQHFKIVLASLVATLAIGFVTKEDFVRYAYPVIFVALVSAYAMAMNLKKWILPAIAVCGLIPVWNMWTADDESRLSLWPSILTRELYFSGYTVMPGVPLHRWAVFSGDKKDGLCLFVTAKNSEKPWAIANYFKYVGYKVKVFSESQAAEFEHCHGLKAFVRRQYSDQPSDCAPQCPAGSEIDACVRQEIRGWADARSPANGVLTNKTCLP